MVMEPNFEQLLIKLEEKIDNIYLSVEKTRKYFLWTLIITVVVLVIPVIGLMFVLPMFMNDYVSQLSGLGL